MIGLRLCGGIADEPFCAPVRKGSRTSRHLGALEVADLEADRLARGADGRGHVDHLGVAVTGDHLCSRHRLQAEALTHVLLDPGVDVL